MQTELNSLKECGKRNYLPHWTGKRTEPRKTNFLIVSTLLFVQIMQIKLL